MVTGTELKKFFEGKKVFLTGHTGFKGAWMTVWLNRLGAVVKGYALEAENPSLYVDIDGDHLCESVIADIRNAQQLSSAVQEFQPDIIYHMAAQPLVLDAYNRPVYTFEVNAIGTANLLEAAKLVDKKCTIINITTDKVYENREWFYPYRENDHLGGYDPYSASKACAELVSASYRSSFFNLKDYSKHQTSLATVRAGNVIGGGDWAENRIIPDIVRAVSDGKQVTLRNPHAVRPWQHVLEALYGYLLLAIRMDEDPIRFSEPYNFGPLFDEAITVEFLVQQAIEEWGKGSYVVEQQKGQLHEAKLLRLDCSKAVNELKWYPRWNAKQAIQNTIKWYKEALDKKQSPLEITRAQIQAYLS
ncbi:CDP-glucose 4,6-dehydratase [Aureispira sp. CCB-E]|uniref:CDP-glucose 4,6-dehydratase n=1 Tax=Aureispira sp. CCB-E TaxID=3051121 RepID=UPI002868AAFC|nr:CDP-glucose 4,6-dehydratase [Aureispira sp. CCB-E]WMX15220.1 CDP-glucose 4,6-dehydratase [Aureispira sp. CCB-E]